MVVAIGWSDLQWAGRSGDQVPVEARFSVPVQIGPKFHPVSCTRGTRYIELLKQPVTLPVDWSCISTFPLRLQKNVMV